MTSPTWPWPYPTTGLFRLQQQRAIARMQKKKRQLPPERVTVEINDLLVKELFLSDPTLRGLDPEKYIQQIPCLNCGRVRHEHAKLKCPFDVTWYRPDPKY